MFICPPALIYLIFCIIQIILDVFNGLYNTALVKTFIAIIITILLNVLCSIGLGIVSWIIVFIPFIFMTVIVTMILYIFGLDVATGKNITTTNVQEENVQVQHEQTITSPPYPPWMLPNNPTNQYLFMTENNQNQEQVPSAITTMPIQNLGPNLHIPYSTSPQYTN